MKITIKPHESIYEKIKDIPHNEPLQIYLEPGIYHEKLRLVHHDITIHGSELGKTIISNNDYAYKMHEDNLLYNTFRTYTMLVLSHTFKMYHVTVENTCGSGSMIGQGVALSLLSKHSMLMNCQLRAHQDTLFIGPLPIDLNERYDHFLPIEERSDAITHHYFKDCLIEGDVDYIFGSGVAYFESCDIRSLATGYIAAPSTYASFPYGFVFDHCRFQIENNAISYLGRPWREHGSIHLLNCQFNGLIQDERYHAWDKKNMRFYEEPYIPSPLSHPLSQEEVDKLKHYIKTYIKF